MKNLIHKLFAVVALASLVACGDLQKRSVGQSTSQINSEKISTQNQISGTGVVHFNDTEGGHFVIWADDGRTFLPSNLQKDFQVDQLKVQFTGEIAHDAFMNAMSGEILSLSSISPLL